MPAPIGPQRVNPHSHTTLRTIEDAAANGLTIPTIAAALGMHPSTLYRWLDLGSAESEHNADPRPDLGSLVDVCEAFERGVARFEERNIGIISEAAAPAPGRWQAAAWLNERNPYTKKRWSQRTEQEVEQRSVTVTVTVEGAAAERIALALQNELPLLQPGDHRGGADSASPPRGGGVVLDHPADPA